MVLLVLPPFLRYSTKWQAIALYPFVIVKEPSLKNDVFLLNHEKIHLRQQRELLILPFYLMYVANFLYNLARYRDVDKAYYEILFEQEAYRFEKNLDYLKHRKPFACFR